MLSILIPTYNDLCVKLVKALAAQASAIKDLRYEILVADDGSTREDVIEANRAINELAHCRYIERKENVGRAAIRNFLGYTAQYPYLLFLDCEVKIPAGFLEKYLLHIDDAEVLCGGVCAGGEAEELQHNLRFIYEKHAETSYSAAERNKKGFRSFRTTNYVILRSTFYHMPFNEKIRTYGYEDVYLGMDLMVCGARILHIDNAVEMYRYEDNQRYMEKMEEALRTLKVLSPELEGFSSIIDTEKWLRRLHLLSISRWCFNMTKKKLRTNLTGSNPKLICFKVYKLGYYLSL